MLTVGPYELHAIETGRFRLDGGAMFGVVPKVLWSRQVPADAHNRIALAMRALLAIDRSAGRVILVDSGAGHKWNADEIERFALAPQPDALGAGLKRLGLDENDVTDVIVTHLHFDHNGGLTCWENGSTADAVPRFGSACHWIHAGHLAHARAPTPKDRGSFYARDFEPVDAAGLFEFVEGPQPAWALPQVTWLVVHGHTPFQLLPRFDDGQVAVQYLGDLIPTAAHLALPWVMAYDNEPLKTMAEKERLLRETMERDLVFFFEHDTQLAGARIDTRGRKPVVREAVPF